MRSPFLSLEPRIELLPKIESRQAHVVVIGIGYVGLSLVAEFARAGFRTTGLDKDAEKVRLLNAGESYVADVPTSDLAPHVQSRLLDATTDPAVLREADAVIVCVPTPLNKTKEPDMRFIDGGDRRDRAPSARRHAGDPRVDDLSGNDDRSTRCPS